MSPEEFRHYGHQLIDWLADQRQYIQDGVPPVMAPVSPGALRSKLPSTPPQQAEPFSALLKDLNALVAPHCSHFLHPSFFGYFPSNGELSSVLADLASTGLGQLGLNWQSSPALTEVEEVATDWLRQLLGLSEHWHGVIQDTASTSTLVALLSARERSSDYGATCGGLQQVHKPLVIYTSAQAHSSVHKAVLLAGFGKQHMRLIETDTDYAIRPAALERAIRADLEQGLQPCAIIASVGTTGTTAIDPLEPIAALAEQFNLWLHVDAALAGSAMILPECRQLFAGIERADSLVLNPHKWLGVAFDCSTYYVRDPQHLIRVMSSNPSYLQTAADGSAKNYRDWGIPLGRRFRALKLWFLLREQGVDGLQARLRRDLANAQWLADQIRQTEDWKILAPVPLQTLCVRHEPAGLSGDALDQHTLGWVNRINASGRAYLTPSQLDGRWMVRVSIGALPTERQHVEALWALMLKEAVS
ncbi:aspartate aminotransferase family protein [Permianibacter sp. IMCC34836]|uniref:pyridoxal phosphate-dependent decarboxylase family protein n=1 Tax=Permianibacter fluminis TaxID=2738515 RepID=UPI001555635D|nr:pyridoxal-dependent decarboxylase [Permianibacter fluminis]NQD35685.1 aspartate aminotransferase family protein [Permianibacter fluminis]